MVTKKLTSDDIWIKAQKLVKEYTKPGFKEAIEKEMKKMNGVEVSLFTEYIACSHMTVAMVCKIKLLK